MAELNPRRMKSQRANHTAHLSVVKVRIQRIVFPALLSLIPRA